MSLAFDWNISPDAVLQLDAEYQNKQQRSVPGYQLLGGSEVPHGASPKKLLGHQSGAKPVDIDSLNLNGKFEYRFSDQWTGQLSAARSKVVIDDYSSFAWGCYYIGSCNANTFSPEGDYDIYDYRSPDDTRRDDEMQAAMTGLFDTAGLGHELTFGTSAFRRVIDQRTAVNERIGSGNIHQDAATFAPTDVPLNDSHRSLDSRQYGLFVTDRIRFNEQWQTVLGGREVRLDEQAFDSNGSPSRHTQQYVFLPRRR